MAAKKKKTKSIAKGRRAGGKNNAEKRAKALTRLASNQWPKTRDVIFRPERLAYVKKMIKTDGCVFCQAKASGVSFESLCLYHDNKVVVVLNKFPYNTGHIMVVPARHVGNLSEISVDEHLAVQAMLHKVVKVVQDEYKCGGMNIGLNMGALAGAGLPDHLHWHIVPRWAGDTNFFPLIADTKVLPEALEQTYERYKKYFT